MTEPRARRYRHWASRALTTVFFAVLAGVGFLWTALGVSGGGAAVGLIGVQGSITVTACDTRQAARGGDTTHCRGTFVSADGRITDRHAETDPAEARPGDQLRVRSVITGVYTVEDMSSGALHILGIVGGGIASAVGFYGMFRAPALSEVRASWRSWSRVRSGR
ncbi:hypothetical protein [Streptomyces marianii]|uniref:DUF3592 domain-containing protein n=1 Tax=Streptomyces marianii TaxID=1817406 RepID=A0A5R9EE78_9ACTN|nr:hypothetical protein [Streptomyces marianii]TLQ47069.1 hypothetical protein FEF34_32570 [Streptomyces marianii]